MNDITYSRYSKSSNRRKSHGLEFRASGLMPVYDRSIKKSVGKDRSYGITSPQKFNPLGKESPLMRIDRSLPMANNTMSKFYNSKNNGLPDSGIPNIRTALTENTTVNVRGKLKQLENEIIGKCIYIGKFILLLFKAET